MTLLLLVPHHSTPCITSSYNFVRRSMFNFVLYIMFCKCIYNYLRFANMSTFYYRVQSSICCKRITYSWHPYYHQSFVLTMISQNWWNLEYIIILFFVLVVFYNVCFDFSLTFQHLSFLYPLKRIQSDLTLKLRQKSSAASVYKWIRVWYLIILFVVQSTFHNSL